MLKIARLGTAMLCALFLLFPPVARSEPDGANMLDRMIAAWEGGQLRDVGYYAATSADVPAYYLLAVAWGKNDLPADRAGRVGRALLGRLTADAARDGACVGWGIGAPLDAFGDGSVNPPETIYLYTTARVVMALLEAERQQLIVLDDALLEGVSCTLRTLFDFRPAIPAITYSNNANDRGYVVYNVFADLARAGIALARRLNDDLLLEIARQSCDVLIRRQRDDGALPYMEGGDDNDGSHHAMVVAGLFECARSFATPLEPALRSARLLLDEFIGAAGERIEAHPYQEWMLGEALVAFRMACEIVAEYCTAIDTIAAHLRARERDGLINNDNARYQSWLAAGVAYARVR